MRLSNLIASNDGLTLHGHDTEILGITADSREVKPGFLFIAIPGTQADGRQYIPEAVKQGAVAIMGPVGTQIDSQVAFVTAHDIRKGVSSVAAKFYPRQPLMIAAVTGTSGKTSTAQFVREMWKAIGHKSASIGTLGLVTDDETHYGSLTTPDAITLHRLLSESADKGITHVAMEASSHGLVLHRLDNVHIKVGGFTNLSRDHLDYHQTMENYLAAKRRLFTDIIISGGAAVLNADVPEFQDIAASAKQRGLKVISYGHNGKEIRLIDSKPDAKGQKLSFEMNGKKHEVLLPVIGSFQAWNGLCALGMVVASGASEDKAVQSLASVTGVPGRLQLAGTTKKGAAIFVDYAHKPDALENVLKALRPHVAAHKGSKLGVVFGCGGNRDKGKRPIMGEIASRLADWVIVTDDNPRQEEPAVIRKEILAGSVSGKALREIGDRAEAIAAGIAALSANDVLVIAGKGHESGQIVGDKVLPFDDAEVARKVLG
ncbi:MAG TPA: UDP-N-acetylmuramoyl-L-alanyl-D-glutamate--2,6-diaminopimelate ligase [Alphaproteobacteria bacterium]|nr:UDP-N-acetylmuramoyl-L-alanyl-D-glutamate--2,6-diaminopimelate ligase [Alphaproteobacteria bacterium]